MPLRKTAPGTFWVSTNKGLAKVNQADLEKFLITSRSDGLQSNEFCDGAVWKDGRAICFLVAHTDSIIFFRKTYVKSAGNPTCLIVGHFDRWKKYCRKTG